MSLYAPVASRQESDGNGRPYAGGLLYTYENGTTNPKVTYDGNGAVQSNPIVLDSEGRYSMRLDNGSYSMTFTDGVGATVYDPAVVEGVVVWSKDGIGYSDSIGTFTTVATMADLRNLAAAADAFVVMKGYNTQGDGGSGIFFWDNLSTSSDDSGVIIKPTGYTGSSGRWHRQFTGSVSPRWFGAKADGSDDAAAFSLAITYCTNYLTALDLGTGTYTLASNPGFTQNIVVIMGDAVLAWSGFQPSINPLIPVSDTMQHFSYGAGEGPFFASDTSGLYAEIKNVWLDGTTSGWYQSSIMNDTSTSLTTVNTALNTRIDNLDTTTADRDTTMASHISLLNGAFLDSTSLYSTVSFLDSTGTAIPVTLNSDTTSFWCRTTKYVDGFDTTQFKDIQLKTYLSAHTTDFSQTTRVAETRFGVDNPVSNRDSSVMLTALNFDGDTSESIVCPVRWYDINTLSISRPSAADSTVTPAITNGVIPLTSWPSPGGGIRLKSVAYGDFSGYYIILNTGAAAGSETITWTSTSVVINYASGVTTVGQLIATEGTNRELGLQYKWGTFSLYSNSGAIIIQSGNFLFSSIASTPIAFIAGVPVGISKIPFLSQINGSYKFHLSLNYESR